MQQSVSIWFSHVKISQRPPIGFRRPRGLPSLPQVLPNVKAVIIGCADMCVDPADMLGIKPGEAVVMRNIGGRITLGLLEQLGPLGRIGEVA